MKEFIDKLIERLEEEHERCINRYGIVGGNAPAMEVKQCMDIVNELAEEYKGGWISVNERLPKKKTWVLVTRKSGVVDIEMLSTKGWISKIDEVIAWCELPAPYTEGEKA